METLASPSQRPMAVAAYRVLIIEDHSHTSALLARLFQQNGWRSDVAGTVADGLVELSSPPDCVIVDLNLPDGRGEQILKVIRDAKLAIRLVVVITASFEIERLSRVATYRPDLTIMKPFDWDVLLRYFESEMRRH